VRLTIHYFGQSAEIANCSSDTLEFAKGNTVRNVLDGIYARHPGLRQINIRLAINKKMADSSEVVSEDAMVAVLPPFAGG